MSGKERACQPLTAIMHPAGEVHKDLFGLEGGHTFSLEFGDAWRDRLEPYSLWIQQPRIYRKERMNQMLYRVVREFREFDSAAPLAIEALALEMVSQMIRKEKRPEKHPPGWLKRVEEFFEEHVDQRLSLRDLSRIAGVHTVHLIRTFRKFHGLTVGEYLRRLRIDLACRLLQTSDQSIADIAHQVGFFDQSHFSRTLRRMKGLTPGQLRSRFQRQ
ncbi:AraC family transcriptional regulator [bacterium]|nr:AraC family transcriptional regulator [bacterium]